MANFNDILKHYKNEVTNQDEQDWIMGADLAAEELSDDLKTFAQSKDPDQFISIIIQTMSHYFDIQMQKFEERQTRKAGFEQNDNKEVDKNVAPESFISKEANGSTEGEDLTSEKNNSTLSESFKEEILDGLKRILP
tara:strand:+ start:4534 stop:4944 length:411 start_codon:yes stop_codon:yes gene_type:complete